MSNPKNPSQISMEAKMEKRSDDNHSLLLNHDYDGIQELDHPLPQWWLGIFYATIVFSVFYVGYYMTGIGPTLQDELKVSMGEIEKQKASATQAAGSGQAPSGDFLKAILQDPERVKNGSTVYTSKCAACHGDKGQGLIGPNLTDDFWLHTDGGLEALAKVIRVGVPEKGMPPWESILPPNEVHEVVAFIGSIHGTQPSGAKEPQGEKREWKVQ